jgi:hypothetical protein
MAGRASISMMAVLALGLYASISAHATSVRLKPVFEYSRILIACSTSVDETANWNAFNLVWDDIDLAAISERDLVLVSIGDTKMAMLQLDGSVAHLRFSNLSKKYVCSQEFTHMLIGKDGDIKKRWTEPPSFQDILQTIDAMPMRQFEMKTRGAN